MPDLEQNKERPREDHHKYRNPHGKCTAREHARADLPPEFIRLPRAVECADKDARAKTDTIGKKQHKCHKRICRADRREGRLADKTPDNHTVSSVVSKLKERSQDQRNREENQFLKERSSCHIFRHAIILP